MDIRDFTLDDFDALFGPDMDGMGGVSFDDRYLAASAVMDAETSESGRIVRGRVQMVAGNAVTSDTFAVRRAWVPGESVEACPMHADEAFDWHRAAVLSVSATIETDDETLDYLRIRNLGVNCGMLAGQEMAMSFRGWAWSPTDRRDGQIWEAAVRPTDALWIRTTDLSQVRDEVIR